MNALERRLRWCALLVLIGLVVEIVSLLWSRPMSFIVFVLAGGGAMAAGIGLFLYSIVSPPKGA
jgi:hypothetical protein